MYRRIMVPLDGSKLAECVLPHVEVLAKGCGTEEVVLVSVTERIGAEALIAWPREAWPISEQARQVGPPFPATPAGPLPVPAPMPGAKAMTKIPVAVGKKQKQAERYLDRIAKRLQKKGMKVGTAVLLGHPAEEITVFAERTGVDLIVMASHGRSGPSRWAYGSVADKVFRGSNRPVLMVRASGA